MAGTYSARTITLKTTKLGESDLILTLLSQDGSLLKGVLKSARNPRSKNVGRGDVFISADVLLAHGKSLDIISEMRVTESFKSLRTEPERMLAASYISEIVLKIAQQDLEQPRLFDMLLSALDALENSSITGLYAITLAFLVKALAIMGLRPSLTRCVDCETAIDSQACTCSGLYWSAEAGGVICEECGDILTARPIQPAAIAWIVQLMMSPFKDLASENMEPSAERVVRECMEEMFEHATSSHLKSSPLFWATRPQAGALE